MSTPTNDDNTIDSRDIIERIEELEGLAEENPANLDDDERAELEALKKLADECEGYVSDWEHGATLIREDYWVDYVKELLADIGTIPKDLPSWVAIDWEKTAEAVAQDYATVDFDGVTYYVR